MKNIIIKGMAIGAVAIGLYGSLVGGATAATPAASDIRKGDVCYVKQEAVANDQAVYSDRQFDQALAFVGCRPSRGFYKQDVSNACQRAAHTIAQSWIDEGNDIMALTVGDVGRALELNQRHNGRMTHDCTLNGNTYRWS